MLKLKLLAVLLLPCAVPVPFHCDPKPRVAHHHGRCNQEDPERSNSGCNGDQSGDHECHSFCGNTIIVPGVPNPGGKSAS